MISLPVRHTPGMEHGNHILTAKKTLRRIKRQGVLIMHSCHCSGQMLQTDLPQSVNGSFNHYTAAMFRSCATLGRHIKRPGNLDYIIVLALFGKTETCGAAEGNLA